MVKKPEKKPNPGGRPKLFEFTPSIIDRVCELAAVGVPIQSIELILNIPRYRLEKELQKNGKPGSVSDIVKRFEESALSDVRKTLHYRALNDKNPACLIFYAKARLGLSERIQLDGNLKLSLNRIISGIHDNEKRRADRRSIENQPKTGYAKLAHNPGYKPSPESENGKGGRPPGAGGDSGEATGGGVDIPLPPLPD